MITLPTLTQAIRDRGSVRMMRRAEMPVSMMAQGPGPVGSAETEKNNYFLSDILPSLGARSWFLHLYSIDLCGYTKYYCYQCGGGEETF